MEDQRGTTGTRVSCLRRCDERTRINTCVNKSLVQTLESCPLSDASACCSANLSTFSRENSKSCWLIKCIHAMDSQKLDALLREPYSYYGCASVSQNGLRSHLRASNFPNISWGSMPPHPPSLACLRKSDIHVTLLLKTLATGIDNRR